LCINLIDDDDELFVGKEGLDGSEEGALLFNGESALFGNVDKVEDGAGEMSQSCDGLHFNGVPFFQGVVEDPGRVDDLPTQIAIVRVSHKE